MKCKSHGNLHNKLEKIIEKLISSLRIKKSTPRIKFETEKKRKRNN